MKKSILIVFFALLSMNFFSCGTSNKNLKNSLDWAGVYTGVIPAASSEGIKVEMTLNNDGTYRVNYQYLGKGDDDVFAHTGTFKWNNDGNTVILDSEEIPPYYKVGENTLIQLDMRGKKIVGNLADNYVLKKKQ
jgi:uncharacterized lipoprotein NlpE involved in copper resistance